MQGIWPKHGHFDLSSKNGKTSWNVFQLFFAVWKFATPKRQNGAGDFWRPKGGFSRPKGDLKQSTFLMRHFQLGPEHVPVEAHPRQNSNMLLQLQQAGA